jgi:hypothetical protein
MWLQNSLNGKHNVLVSLNVDFKPVKHIKSTEYKDEK